MREPRWERTVIRAMKRLGRTDSELRTDAKGAEWKVAVARHLRERCLTPNRWIAERLNMGATSSVQSLVSRHRKKKHEKNSNWILLNHETLDWCFSSSLFNQVLTPRELEILSLLSDGLVKKQIGDRLDISFATVDTHIRHIYEKLDVKNAPAAVRKAFNLGLFKA